MEKLTLLLLFTTFSQGDAAADDCPPGWSAFGLKCAKFFPQTLDWLSAEKYCQTFGGNLASVHSESENDLLLNMVPGTTRAYIGGHDAVKWHSAPYRTTQQKQPKTTKSPEVWRSSGGVVGQAHEEEEGVDRGLDCAAVADLDRGAVVDLARGSMVDLGREAEGHGAKGGPGPWSSGPWSVGGPGRWSRGSWNNGGPGPWSSGRPWLWIIDPFTAHVIK
ncbi:Galactose-specific lectin nattectin [Anabarilius grahami]|uniref:Galactose-specific lectin nattectin n=1 Tax=Anabarilius grahami TaxID=495550 RepID=A0A3N0XLK5_ANAGA|nr:Galactose-specific lectin nattectin [Anabarilius grahami]